MMGTMRPRLPLISTRHIVRHRTRSTSETSSATSMPVHETRARHNENTQDPVVHTEHLVKTMDRSV